MKQILTILFLLLISSPVFGDNHKGEKLYKWKTSAGEVWMGFGDKDTPPNYNGQVENGEPSGLGVIYYPNGNMYVGEWKDGKRNGRGTYTFNEGSKYEGEWKDGKYNGQGTYTLIDGNRFEGEWKAGKPWNLTIADKNGNIIRKWDNGVEQKDTPQN